jgi:poly-gamma-glutamate capsule biosynthesis protein CapA/YwtB (metallophosphatase superfamily)
MLKLALAGDTMLGRGVGSALSSGAADSLWSPDVVEVAREADLFIVNLECCISDRGAPWPKRSHPFFFRAPPVAAEILARLGVHCVTLANNHTLDYGYVALNDTFEHLTAAGVKWVGAGRDVAQARRPVFIEARGLRLAIVAFTDHPRDYGAEADRPGVALASIRDEVPGWLFESLAQAGSSADYVLLTPHWGPNGTLAPLPSIAAAAEALCGRATLIAGHSAHVFHGVQANVLYDLGDFIDDYRLSGRRDLVSEVRSIAGGPARWWQTKRLLRRALRRARGGAYRPYLGLLFLVTLDRGKPLRIEAVGLKLDYCQTRLAHGEDAAWIRRRFTQACAALGTAVTEESGRLVVQGPTTR